MNHGQARRKISRPRNTFITKFQAIKGFTSTVVKESMALCLLLASQLAILFAIGGWV